jgi:hypothetical protein
MGCGPYRQLNTYFQSQNLLWCSTRASATRRVQSKYVQTHRRELKVRLSEALGRVIEHLENKTYDIY